MRGLMFSDELLPYKLHLLNVRLLLFGFSLFFSFEFQVESFYCFAWSVDLQHVDFRVLWYANCIEEPLAQTQNVFLLLWFVQSWLYKPLPSFVAFNYLNQSFAFVSFTDWVVSFSYPISPSFVCFNFSINQFFQLLF